MILGPDFREDLQRPSVSPEFIERDISSIMRRLTEVEEKVQTLQTKPVQMPSEKEELLNAAIYRVDALEAELIATKKVSCLASLCYMVLIWLKL